MTVLALHEIESVLCDNEVVAALAEHLGKNSLEVSDAFIKRVRGAFHGDALSALIARRVRARVGDLLHGAFNGAQISSDLNKTSENHATHLANLDLPGKTKAIFSEENKRVAAALADGGAQMLAVLPGKHILGILSTLLGFANPKELTSLVIRSLNRKHFTKDDPLIPLAKKIEAALLKYLPSRAL